MKKIKSLFLIDLCLNLINNKEIITTLLLTSGFNL